jgi:molecular chaperone DnaK (HSP70)
LSVTAKELRTGKVQSIEVKPSYGLTEDEVEKMIDESFRHAKADMEERLLIEARTEAEGIIHHAEKVVVQGANLVPPEELEEIRKNLEALKEKVKGADRHAIREGVERLDRSAEGLTQALMNQAVRGALKKKKLSDL